MRHRVTLCEKLVRCLYCGSVFATVEAALAEDCPRSRQGQQREGRIMIDQARERIERELASAMDRLRQLGGTVVIEEFPGAVDDDGLLADPAERGKIHEDREVILATRSLLVERANRLAGGLGRLRQSPERVCERG